MDGGRGGSGSGWGDSGVAGMGRNGVDNGVSSDTVKTQLFLTGMAGGPRSSGGGDGQIRFDPTGVSWVSGFSSTAELSLSELADSRSKLHNKRLA